jgi:hypothetical protein
MSFGGDSSSRRLRSRTRAWYAAGYCASPPHSRSLDRFGQALIRDAKRHFVGIVGHRRCPPQGGGGSHRTVAPVANDGAAIIRQAFGHLGEDLERLERPHLSRVRDQDLLNVARQRFERLAGEADRYRGRLKPPTISLEDKNPISLPARCVTAMAKELDRPVQVLCRDANHARVGFVGHWRRTNTARLSRNIGQCTYSGAAQGR